MRHIIRGLSFLLMLIFINGILGFMRQSRQEEKGEEKGKVRLPKTFGILGIIGFAIFLIPGIITAFLDEPLYIPTIFLALSALGASMLIGFINCRISYDEAGFTAKSFLGIKRQFTYDQVTAIKENPHERFIYVGKHWVMIDELAVGGAAFISQVKEKYRVTHDGKSLPPINKAKYDLFNGNVTDPIGVLVAYILVTVLLLGLAGYIVVFVWFSPGTTSNTIEQTVCFTACHASREEVVLTSADGQSYVIRFIDEQFDARNIRAVCDGKTVVTAYSTEVTPDDAEDYYAVKAIVHNGRYLLRFEETDRFHRQEYWPLILFAAGMLLFWGVYVVGGIIVGRNPRRFSREFVGFFFRDEYIRY